MEFKVGQKYKIVDIDAWWNNDRYDDYEDGFVDGEFKNGDIVVVVENDGDDMCFALYPEKRFSSMYIDALINHRVSKWSDGCIQLITDDIADVSKMEESDDTISIYHIADVLEDALNDGELLMNVDTIELCIKSLRKVGY